MADLEELIYKYRKGRDGFDALALEVTELYLAGRLLPPPDAGEDRTLPERLIALERDELERALDGKLGTVPMTRDEYREVLEDILAFLKEWLGSSD